MRRSRVLNLVVAALAAAPLLGSGYGVAEQGVQGQGNAGAHIARAEDGSAMFYNPAGLANMKYSELSFSLVPVLTKSFYSNAGQTTSESEAQVDVLPTLFWNFKLGGLFLGLGTTTTQNHKVAWNSADFPGRYLSTGSEFRTQEYFGAVAYSLTDGLRLGATFRYAQSDFSLFRVQPRPIPSQSFLFYETGQKLSVDGDGFGATVGLQYSKSRRFSLGLSYQTAIDMDLDGRQTYSLLTRQDDQRVQDAFGQTFRDGPVSTSFEIPERISIGVSSKVTVRTRVELNLNQERWSVVDRQVFESIDAQGNADSRVLDRRWDDALAIRLGGDFQQRKALLWRIGLASEEGIVPAQTLEPGFPDHDRFLYSFGVSYTWHERYIFEAAWLYVQYRDRNVTGQELVYADEPPDYSVPTGQGGLLETQRTHFNLGLRIRFGQ